MHGGDHQYDRLLLCAALEDARQLDLESRPVLLSDCNPVDPERWSPGALAEAFGETEVHTCSDRVAVSRNMSRFKGQTLSGQLSNSENKGYMFDSSFLTWAAPELLSALHLPDFLQQQRGKFDLMIMGLGDEGTGAAFHRHDRSWCYCVSGLKLWALYPPNIADTQIPKGLKMVFSQTKQLQGESEVQEVVSMVDRMCQNAPEEGKPLRLVQHPGEILCLPPQWHHATINLAPQTACVVYVRNKG